MAKKVVVLDTGVLGNAIRPARHQELARWLSSCGHQFYIPEIADYELRRELLRAKFAESVKRLDELEQAVNYLPLSTDDMRRAAELWANLRQRGLPTADNTALDGDVILAAQAERVKKTLVALGQDVIIATENVGHLTRLFPACEWKKI